MTLHPARPRYPDGYRPFTDPAELRAELEDLAAMAAEGGFNAPLRDVLAHLIERDRRVTLVCSWPVVLSDAVRNLSWALNR